MSADFDVIVLTTEFPPYIVGGLGVYVTTLVQSLVEDGLRVAVVCPKFVGVEAAERQWLADSCCVFRVPLATQYAYSIEASVEMQAGVRGLVTAGLLRAPTVHLHESHLVEAGEELRRLLDAKLVLTVHLALAQLHQYKDPDTDPDKLRWAKHFSELEQRAVQSADSIISVSRYMKRFLCRSYRLPSDKMAPVYFPAETLMDSDHLRPLAAPERRRLRRKLVRSDERIALFAGRVTPQKGMNFFAEAVISERLRRRNVRGLIVGGAPTISFLYQMVSATHAGNLMPIPFLSWDDLSRFYQVADFGVIPSLTEPFGIVALEMVACGLPIVYADVDGLGEILGPLADATPCLQSVTVRGRRRRRIDVRELEDAMCRLLAKSDEKARARYRQLGREYLRENFSVGTFVQVHRDAYAA